MLNRNSDFNLVHKSLDGWGFSFRRSQLFRFNKYKNILNTIKINGNILEIGCSTGFFSAKYLYPLFLKNLIACDISSVAIEKAKSE